MHDIRLVLGIWLITGVVDGAVHVALRRRRWNWSVGLVLHAGWSLLMWWGVLGMGVHPDPMIRAGVGIILTAAMATAVLMPLTGEVDLRDYAVLAWITGAVLYAVQVSDPLAVAFMIGAGSALVAGWWFYCAPGTETLRAARLLGVAAGLLLAAAIFLPVQVTAVATKFAFVAWLYIAVLVIYTGCIPVQGWLVSVLHRLQGRHLLLWISVVVPGTLIVLERAIQIQPLPVQNIILQTTLGIGCISAVWEGILSVRMSSPRERHARLLLMDTALMVVGVGSGSPYGWTGTFLLVLVHVGTLAFVGDREGSTTGRKGRMGAWILLGGIPFTGVFWGRWLILLAAWDAGSWYPWFVIAAMGLAAFSSFRQARFERDLPEVTPAFRSWIPLGILSLQLVLGLAPATICSFVFGMTLLPGVGH